MLERGKVTFDGTLAIEGARRHEVNWVQHGRRVRSNSAEHPDRRLWIETNLGRLASPLDVELGNWSIMCCCVWLMLIELEV